MIRILLGIVNITLHMAMGIERSNRQKSYFIHSFFLSFFSLICYSCRDYSNKTPNTYTHTLLLVQANDKWNNKYTNQNVFLDPAVMLYIHSMHVKLFRQFTKRTNRLSKNKGHADSKVSCKEWLWRKSICNFIDLIWSQIEVTTICMVTTQWRTSISKKEKETMKWCNLQQLHAHTLPASNFNVPNDDIEKHWVFFAWKLPGNKSNGMFFPFQKFK